MSRIEEIRDRLSVMLLNEKHIIYFVTEDRDAVTYFFSQPEIIPMVKDLGRVGQNYQPDDFCASLEQNHYMADASTLWPIATRIIEDLRHPENMTERADGTSPGSLDQMHPIAVDKAVFFVLNDFPIYAPQSRAFFLKKFLELVKERQTLPPNPLQLSRGTAPREAYLLLTGPVLELPAGFEMEVEVIDVPELSEEDICREILYPAARAKSPHWPLDRSEEKRISEFARSCKGLSRADITTLVRRLEATYVTFYGTSELNRKNSALIEKLEKARNREVKLMKERSASQDSTVTLKEPEKSVAGLAGYTQWIEETKDNFLHPDQAKAWGSRPPKGVLLTGIPGCGKTQAAKMTAAEMGVPMVELRMDNLLGGIVGTSEANFKRCRKRVDALAPCVVLIDEIEKVFGTDNGGSGGSHEVKQHLLTALLDWLQENRKPIFFYATSNNVNSLHSALLRDGRFDKRFFVFMPTHSELRDIFDYHLKNIMRSSANGFFQSFDRCKLADDFLDWIADFDKDQTKHLLYTGANVESLIIQTNRRLQRLRQSDALKGKHAQNKYLNALKETVENGGSQPYGQTNLDDIALFWLEARKKSYADASGTESLFPFHQFNQVTGEFDQVDDIKKNHTSKYDQYLFDCVSARIRAIYV